MPRIPRVAPVLGLALLAVGVSPVLAQFPQPRLTSVYPLGASRADTVEITLRGTDLEGVTQVWFDHPGLRAFHLKGLTFRVACASGVPLGQHDIRAVGPFGVSNPRTFVVGDRPESKEIEPNNTPDKANTVALNTVVNGELTATDTDCLAFEGKRGQRVFLDLAAERLESRLDATLRVLDPEGREIAENRDTNGGDPFLDVTLPKDGRYVVKVYDVIFGGSPDHVYRLTIHDGPHLDAIVPVVAEPAAPAAFTLIGRNLGGIPAPELSVEGQPVERTEVAFTANAAMVPDPTYPSAELVPAQAAGRRGFEYALTTVTGTSNRLFVAEAADPVVLERESNGDQEHAQKVTVPCEISGTFGAPNDTDIYRFSAKKGAIYWIEASAERLGSPADPTFLVQRVTDNAPPQDLAAGEDLPDQGAGARFNMATVDASVRWQVPEDGTYQVVVSDLYSSQRGGPRLSYRLQIRPERPDFRVFLVPSAPNVIESLNVRAGGRVSANVVAWRIDNFNGPIRIEPVELPAGVSCAPVVIAAGQSSAPIVFEGAEAAKPDVGRILLVGKGRWGDRKDELKYTAGVATLGPDVSQPVLAGGMIWPPLNPMAPTLAPARLQRGIVLAVVDTAPLALAATPAAWTVPQGHRLDLDLSVTRREGFVAPVSVTGADLPPNLTNGSVTIAKEASTGRISLFVAKTVPPGTYTFLLRASGPFPFSKDPKAKQKPNITLNEPSNPIVLSVRPAPVALAVNNKGGALKAGQSLEIEATVTRQNGFDGPVTLGLNAPANLKLSAASVTIAAGQTSGKLVVAAAPDSPPGAAAGVDVRALAAVRSEPVEVDEPVALTIAE